MEALKENQVKKKYIKNTLSQRNFENVYQLGKVFDLDKIEVEMELGILKIWLPLKEKEKPIRRDIEIM